MSNIDFFKSLKKEFIPVDKTILVTKKEINKVKRYKGRHSTGPFNYVNVFTIIGKDIDNNLDVILNTDTVLYNQLNIDSTYNVNVLDEKIRKINPK